MWRAYVSFLLNNKTLDLIRRKEVCMKIFADSNPKHLMDIITFKNSFIVDFSFGKIKAALLFFMRGCLRRKQNTICRFLWVPVYERVGFLLFLEATNFLNPAAPCRLIRFSLFALLFAKALKKSVMRLKWSTNEAKKSRRALQNKKE